MTSESSLPPECTLHRSQTIMELDTPPPSSQNPASDASRQIPPAQPQAELSNATFPPTSQETIFRSLSTYPFDSDRDYLAGLATILGHPETLPTQAELNTNHDLVLQAQCFYFTRRANLPQPIDVQAYSAWLSSQAEAQAQLTGITENASPQAQPPTSPPPRPHAPTPATAAAATTLSVQPHQQVPSPQPSQQPAAEPTPPYPTSFADIVELITQNKPIPGIEEIPDTVLELGSSKRDTAVRRKKPWEKDEDESTAETAPELDPLAERRLADQNVGVGSRAATGDGVVKILQPGAIPGSGLVADE